MRVVAMQAAAMSEYIEMMAEEQDDLSEALKQMYEALNKARHGRPKREEGACA